MNKWFNYFFILIVLVDLLAQQLLNVPEIRYFTKPAIAGSLFVLVFGKTFSSSLLKHSILAALIFSIAGDLLLLFTEDGGVYFLLGLLGFLLAHACYILAFVHRGYLHNAKLAWPGLLAVAYAIFVYQYIADGLGDRQPYVIAYMFILIMLLLVALLRRSYVSKTSYLWVLAGAMLFMLSDSLLAVNAFKTPVPFAGIAIMVTYAMAQWFLVHGAIEQNKPASS